MKRTTQWLGATSSIALVVAGTVPAMAEGTSAGDPITNNVTVSYQVGGVDQTDETDSDSFAVDRKVNVVVEEDGDDTTSVAPGEEQAVLTFDVTNSSNDIVDLDLSADDVSGDLTNIQFYEDDGDGVFDASTDTLVTFLDEMGEDETRKVFVVADIPTDAANGATYDVVLTADAHAGGTASSLGAELTNSATDSVDRNVVDTVLADGAGDTDNAEEGDFSDTDTYVVSAASVAVSKISTVVSDPINGTTDPKAIPGAVIEYCITVSNASGATATGINVNDVLPADVTFDPTDAIFVDGDAACENGTDGTTTSPVTASFNATDGEIDGVLTDIAAGVTRSLYFQVTID
ncbi:MAG: hypothetical protein AAGK02_09575 [Pseudomonadota bacterium]